MAFGQQSGPPASARRVQALLTLLQNAGHDDFRDARGPMGFTQRQAGGKFTSDEVEAFIDQLEQAEFESGEPTPVATAPRPTKAEQLMKRLTSEQLAAELQSRGWVVIEP